MKLHPQNEIPNATPETPNRNRHLQLHDVKNAVVLVLVLTSEKKCPPQE